MNCPECEKEMEQIDTTYSNVNTERAKKEQHTGNIYRCDDCDLLWLENLLNNGILEAWAY